jgi:hypothetical protein
MRDIFDARAARKIAVKVTEELLAKAQRSTCAVITQTVRIGLQLAVASDAYGRLLNSRGKVRFKHSLPELKADR